MKRMKRIQTANLFDILWLLDRQEGVPAKIHGTPFKVEPKSESPSKWGKISKHDQDI